MRSSTNVVRAAKLCKADLLTGMVGEFPELQGIMGGEYAKHDGESEAVSQAIREQYLPRSIDGDIAQDHRSGRCCRWPIGWIRSRLFSMWGLCRPDREDPFALRRHATAIVRIILESGLRLDLGECIDARKNARDRLTDSRESQIPSKKAVAALSNSFLSGFGTMAGWSMRCGMMSSKRCSSRPMTSRWILSILF